MAKDTILLNGECHVVTQCGTCGVWHTVPEIVWDTQVREGGFHSCPNGHSRGWKTGEEQKEQDRIRRERDQLRQQIAQRDDEIRDKERLLADERAKAARVKKRTSAGVCPCCHRTVGQMARHIKNKHPNFIAETIN